MKVEGAIFWAWWRVGLRGVAFFPFFWGWNMFFFVPTKDDVYDTLQ